MTPPDRIRFHAVRALATALLVVMSVRAAHAQPVAPRFLTERLAPGVWAVRPVDSVGFGMDANSLVVEGRTGALVVDAQMSATSTRAVIAAVRAVTRRPVRYLVHTHWHDDHVAGAAEWQRAVPDIVIVGGTRMAADMATQGAKNRAGFLGQIPGTVAYLRDLAAKRRGLDGAATDSTETAAYVRYAKLIERFAAESALVPHVAPTRTVDDSLVLELGARRVVARVIGAGHTAADVVVDVPDAGVIATGDLVITPVPFVGSTSFPRSYAATLGRLLL
ncbi:MAG: MBL fold metallo-hydrolase, partial [Gemmatimonadetes bacterium]|nr:MBL fold metallo-hydrolase [Gemmatimonadota bacterium]